MLLFLSLCSCGSPQPKNEPAIKVGVPQSAALHRPGSTLYVKADSVEERAAPHASAEVLGRSGKGQAVIIREEVSGWIRITPDKVRPRWVDLRGLSGNPVAPLGQVYIPAEYRDQRIAAGAIPEYVRGGLTGEDVILMWRGAKSLLNQRRCTQVESAAKSVGVPGAYYVQDGERTIYFTRAELLALAEGGSAQYAEQDQASEEDSPDQQTLKFYKLADVAKSAANAGRLDDAERWANELLEMAPRYRNDWNYGNAIHDGHVVLGRVALRRGDVETAKQHLLEAGMTPGSPQLNSFGPNMTLARDLLSKGEREVVIEYFDECSRFWSHRDELREWTMDVVQGRLPDFGAHLVY